MTVFNDCIIQLNAKNYFGYISNWEKPEDGQIKPILRPLSSMMPKELIQIEKILPSDDSIDDENAVEMFRSTGLMAKKLLEMHFDLFDLIEEGLALDATTFHLRIKT
jgi:hypothetical protein